MIRLVYDQKRLRACNFMKRDSNTGEYCEVFKRIFLQNTSGGNFFL